MTKKRLESFKIFNFFYFVINKIGKGCEYFVVDNLETERDEINNFISFIRFAITQYHIVDTFLRDTHFELFIFCHKMW